MIISQLFRNLGYIYFVFRCFCDYQILKINSRFHLPKTDAFRYHLHHKKVFLNEKIEKLNQICHPLHHFFINFLWCDSNLGVSFDAVSLSQRHRLSSINTDVVSPIGSPRSISLSLSGVRKTTKSYCFFHYVFHNIKKMLLRKCSYFKR